MRKIKEETTTVVDAGARYGMHPSWREFGGDLIYFAFEPDAREAKRLRKRQQAKSFKVIGCALDEKSGERELFITNHRGYCSFLKPDPRSEWFKRFRPGEGKLEGTRRVKTVAIDHFAKSRGSNLDFLKVDVEGADLHVLRGGAHQISTNVLGIRVGVYFQACYQNQCFFSEIHQFLIEKDFFLLNFDYFGKGVSRNSLFRNPDPLSDDHLRYGTLISCDGVWLKKYDSLCRKWNEDRRKLVFATLKYAYFCLLNHAPDVAMDTLIDFVENRHGVFDAVVRQSKLYLALRRACAQFLGRWRVYPDFQWKTVRSMFKTVFNLELKSGSDYWEMIQSL